MSFIHDFMEYNVGNECPKPYVLWTAYGLLSAAIGRRVFLDMEYYKINCDAYILLVGPSGGRKTAAMILGREMMIEAIPDIVMAGDNETYQGIIQYMHSEKSTRFYTPKDGPAVEYKPYHVFSEELMDYLQLNPIGMVSFLTNIYGKKFYNYRLKNEEHILVNPYVTVLACSTPEWLTDQIKSKQFAEGYGRRTIIVCHSGIVRKKPTLSEASRAAYKRCVARLVQLQTVVGQMRMDKEAHDFFWNWYTNLKDPDEKFLKNWYSTKHVNVLKIAMLSSLAQSDDLTLGLNHIQLALALIHEVEKNINMVSDRIGRSEVTGAIQDVLALLRANAGALPRKVLMAKSLNFFRNTQEQWQCLEHLKSTEQVVEVPIVDPTTQKARQFVCLPGCVKKLDVPSVPVVP